MKLTRCSNGHFYDAEKYSSCPHCSGAGAGDPGTIPFSGAAPSGNSSYSSFTGGDDVTGSFMAPQGGPIPFNQMQGNNDVTVPLGSSGYDDDGEGKTVGFMNWPQGGEGTDNQSGKSEKQRLRETVNPVVGWLVCIEGPNYGKAFPLYTGKNFVGRDAQMDVCLAGDNTISRVRHAIIVYEPRQRIFFAQPGDSHELFYCNGEVVLSSLKLYDRDTIMIGKSVLKFVPFCDASFGWGVEES